MKSIKENVDNLEFLVNCFEGVKNSSHTPFHSKSNLEVNINDDIFEYNTELRNNKQQSSDKKFFFHSSNDVKSLMAKINIQIEKLNFSFNFKPKEFSINDSKMSENSQFNDSDLSTLEKQRMTALVKKFKKLLNENDRTNSQDTDFSSRKSTKNKIFDDEDDFDDDFELNKIDSIFEENDIGNPRQNESKIIKNENKEKFCNCPIF